MRSGSEIVEWLVAALVAVAFIELPVFEGREGGRDIGRVIKRIQ
jgi:hypothetical protein